MFEGVYAVPHGVSYNSYLLEDEQTVLFDTVDKAIASVFYENVYHTLGKRELNYVVIHHMEPDHSATLCELLHRYPSAKVICNQKTSIMINQFFGDDIKSEIIIVKEGDTLNTGKHTLSFYMAPMVHWPEVMVTYDSNDKILFSADAFGTFGALDGAIFADEVDFDTDFMSEARRYYTNIVGKYGSQTLALLKKVTSLEINMICPLHGFVWRYNLDKILSKYEKWGAYIPEEKGVMIAYASIYGNTANAAEILACRLRDVGIKTAVYDVSVTAASEIIASAFKYSHLVFASTTYNAGIFVSMEELLRDIVAHNLQNRVVAFMENGSWAPVSGKFMHEILQPLKNTTFIDNTVTIRSSLKPEQSTQLDALVQSISESMYN